MRRRCPHAARNEASGWRARIMLSLLMAILLVLAAAAVLYLLYLRDGRLYPVLFYAWLMLLLALLVLGAAAETALPVLVYYAPAVSMPVLAFFLFYGRKPLARAIWRTVNLAALLAFLYIVLLALYFHNMYMGPRFEDDPSAVLSLYWYYSCIWFVLPFNAAAVCVLLLKKYRAMRRRAAEMPRQHE